MFYPARALDRLSGGRITPNFVTLVSLLGHFMVVAALWQRRPILAAALLAIFGLMDSLDGALARLQKTNTNMGILFDSVSDRVKEVLVYAGISLWITFEFTSFDGFWLLISVSGMSIIVSYIRARGETIINSASKNKHTDVNKVFNDGIARYEVRMALIIFGLATGTIVTILYILLGLIMYTAVHRMWQVSKALKNV